MEVPKDLRSVIIECRLNASDLLTLLLVVERTLENPSGQRLESHLAIRYIAEQNGFSRKTAETAVAKLKKLGLVWQKISHKGGTGRLSLDYGRFRIEQRVVGDYDNHVKPFVSDHHKVTLQKPGNVAEQLGPDTLMVVRRALRDELNAKKTVDPDLPDESLAVKLLDHFRSVEDVEDWIGTLHAKWLKKKYAVRGYGIYAKELKRLQEAEMWRRWQHAIGANQQEFNLEEWREQLVKKTKRANGF